MYGKATTIAIAAMTRLAEVYDDESILLTATEIADSRGLRRPFVAKILSRLSEAGLIQGTRGPGGGFRFAKHPRTVKLFDVYRLFQHEDESELCPFGGGICGHGDPCPLHDHVAQVKAAVARVLHRTTFDRFRIAFAKQKGAAKWSRSD